MRVHACVCTCARACPCTCERACFRVRVHVCFHARVRVRVRVRACVCVRAYKRACVYACERCACVRVCSCVRVYVCPYVLVCFCLCLRACVRGGRGQGVIYVCGCALSKQSLTVTRHTPRFFFGTIFQNETTKILTALFDNFGEYLPQLCGTAMLVYA